MGKGETTRQAILQHAARQATKVGLTGLSIGTLAKDLELSKSGLFAHFQSKEALQLDIVQYVGAAFTDRVIRPALTAPRGKTRIQAIFDGWFNWVEAKEGARGGCFFVAAATELDDRHGPVRDRLAELQKDWLELIGGVVRTAITHGDFSADVDPEQFAYELNGIMLAYHHSARLLDDPNAAVRARRAFERLVDGSVRGS